MRNVRVVALSILLFASSASAGLKVLGAGTGIALLLIITLIGTVLL